MPPKRKQIDSGNDDSDTLSVKRRRKVEVRYDPMEFCQELYDTIRNHKTEDGRLLCEAFIRVPKRRTEPEYYNAVTTPIDLLKIQHKLQTEEYDEIDQLTQDIELMVNNAKAFYKKSSQEYKDACDLWDLYMDTKNILLAEAFGDVPTQKDMPLNTATNPVKPQAASSFSNESPAPLMTLPLSSLEQEEEASRSSTVTEEESETSQFEQLFSSIITAQEGGRVISEMFKILPSKQKYPEYYEVIKNPMDLRTVAKKIMGNAYTGLEEMVKDLILMVNNAKTFNEPGSQIYKDAMILRRIILNKKTEIENAKPRKSSQRIRSRRQAASTASAPRLTAVCAALEDEPVVETIEENNVTASNIDGIMIYEEDSCAEGSVSEGDDSPHWVLYNAVISYKSPLGFNLSEPFMRLPSKRVYPDYYEEIKRPMSLLNIHKRIKSGYYPHLEDLVLDLDLVFENAKQYNIDESKLYKDAVKLQQVVKNKMKELKSKLETNLDDFSEGEDYESSEVYMRIKGRRSVEVTPGEERKKPGPRRSLTSEEHLRKRLWDLYKTVYDYKVDGRSLVDIFLYLPSKKDYPDYYQVISEPIDMMTIESKIKGDKYSSEQAIMADFELMFNNARHYNEENSQVYHDAETLEKILKSRLRSLPPVDGSPRAFKVSARSAKTPRGKSLSPLAVKLYELYNTMKDYTDGRGRILSTPFMKLPLRSEYPDYYEVIKRPIDMQKVFHKIQSGQYECVEDAVSDYVQMFDNACKYNEPDSLIYKDALTLQRICLEKKQELCIDDSNNVPELRAVVQELMTNLYIATYNHTDEDGRSYSDSFQDLPPPSSVEETEVQSSFPRKAPSFEKVKKDLDRGCYRRMDKFQEDMFEVFEHARHVSRTDSQLYEDAVELQHFFIKQRDEICKNGEILFTPALSYKNRHLQVAVEAEKKEKLPKEHKEDEKKKQQESEEEKKEQTVKEVHGSSAGSETSIEHKGITYHIGDFVYVEARDKTQEPHIVCIERLWRDQLGELYFHGNWFYRPQETYHLATRKFLEKEVFKSDFWDNTAFSRVAGKCYVMNVRDYFKMMPEGFSDKDIYVCESRYTARHKAFKKIKIWSLPKNDSIRIVARPQVLTPVRIASVFADKPPLPTEASEMEDCGGDVLVLDKKREIVQVENPQEPEEGCTYFEQFHTPAGWFKLGDCVYVRSDEERPYVARIDKMWTDANGDSFFNGPWYIHPVDVDHAPTRLFYVHEVFLSSVYDTNPMLSIQGRCAVMSVKEYCSSRITEIPEIDVYLCESKYIEAEKVIKKISKTVKKQTLHPLVCEDEVYFFKKHIIPHKEPSPLLIKASEDIYADIEEELGQSDVSFSQSLCLGNSDNPDDIPSEPSSAIKRKSREPGTKGRGRKGNASAYLIYAAEARRLIQSENPEMTFGEISKVVGAKWRELPKQEKSHYEEKAKKIAEEQAAKQEAAEKAFNESLAMYPPSSSPAPDHRMSSAASRSNGQYGGATPGGASVPPPRPPSPMFVSVPPRTQRLLHSEAYLRYIEGLTPENSDRVSDWERSLHATSENIPLKKQNKLPVNWLGHGHGHHGDAVSALWAMRDLMMKDALSVQRTLEFCQL